MKKFLACLLVVASTGCPDVKVDSDEGPSDDPIVEFDPGNKIVPFPNNLLLSPAGIVTLPPSCNESETAKALRENVLNKLDGFGTFEAAMTVTFSAPVDAASLEGNVLLFKRVTEGAPVAPADAQPVPVVTRVGVTARLDATCANPTMVDQVAIVPLVPLDQKSTYVVGLKSGIKTADGADFGASFTWALIRQPENPVTIDDGVVTSDRTPLEPSDPEDYETLLGIDLLWNMHKDAMAFLAEKGVAHGDVLLAWEFNTQTISDPLDASVTGSPASQIPAATTLVGLRTLVPQGASAEAIMRSALPAGACRDQQNPGGLPCDTVADIQAGALPARQYQIEKPNPVTDPLCDNNTQPCPIPGPWGDPRTPELVKVEPIVTLAFIPSEERCQTQPTTGCPTVIFQHGIGRSRNDVFAIASQFTAIGYNVVAINFVAHGDRAVRVSKDPARLCDDATGPTPGTHPQCFAPFLSPDLANTRDNIRQSTLDHQALVSALKSCGTTNCGVVKVDAAKIEYIGQSLGAIIGGLTVAMRGDIKASVLNVGGVGWVDILENTQTLPIRCSLVDGLIAAGILAGEPWNPQANTGLCTTEEWKTQPGYRQFAVIGRWVLDPADPANFTKQLATRRFLIQEVVDDRVVPNIATDNEAKLTGLFGSVAMADPSVPNPNPPPAILPSPAITTDPLSNKFVRYTTLPADPNTGFPGNTYGHGSLLAPAAADNAGRLATGKMQTDALTYLFANK